MKQRIAPASGDGKPQSADEMAGNKLAGDMAEKAKAAIRAADQVVAASPSLRLSRIDAYLDSVRTLPNKNGQYGDVRMKNIGDICRCDRPEAYKILDLINAGYIEEETMRWTERSCNEHQDNLICVCLKPRCRIGPFIPFRK